MSRWAVTYLDQAVDDLKRIKEPRASHARKAIDKAAENPLPFTEGGYGRPLGNKRGQNLTGLLKLKLRGDGIRVVYALERDEHLMRILVISVRDNMQVYEIAARRQSKDAD